MNHSSMEIPKSRPAADGVQIWAGSEESHHTACGFAGRSLGQLWVARCEPGTETLPEKAEKVGNGN